MITKRNFIDLIRNRLAGGTSPQDLNKMYPYGVVSKMVNLGMADVVRSNPTASFDMAIEYQYEVKKDANGFYIDLYPQPIIGTDSIYMITDEGGNSYDSQDKVTASALSILRGKNSDAAIYFGNKIRFNKEPNGKIFLTQVPNVYQMEDDDILIPNMGPEDFGETQFFQMIFNLLKTPEYQDNLNNNSIDAQQNA